MSKPKLTINAFEVLDDLRSGMDDQCMMIKYDLNYRQLQRLFRKLIMAELISPMELAQRLCVTESQITQTLGVMEKNKQRDEPDR